MTSPYLDTSPTDLKNRTTAVRFVAADGGRHDRANYADESGPEKPHRPYPDELYGHELTEQTPESEPNHRDKDEWLDYQESHEDEHEPPVLHSYQVENARGDGGRGDEGQSHERRKSRQRALHQAPQQQGQGGHQGRPDQRGRRRDQQQPRGQQSSGRQPGSRHQQRQTRQRQDQQRRNYQSGEAIGDLNPERGAGGSGNRSSTDRNRGQRAVDDPYGGELIPQESGGGQGHGDRQQGRSRRQGGHSQGRRQSRHGQSQQGSRGQAPRHGRQQSGSQSQQRQRSDQTRRPGSRQPQRSQQHQQHQQRPEHRRDSGHRRHQQQGRQQGGGSHREQAEHRDLPGQQHQHQSGRGHRPEGSGKEPPHERAREDRDRRGPDASTHWKGGS